MKNNSSGALPDDVYELSTGVYVKASIVGALLIEREQAGIPDPVAPIVDGVENPMHPEYIAALAMTERLRSEAAMTTMIEFGLELVDKDGNELSPPDGKWAQKLKRKGIDIDLDDPVSLEMNYLKYIAVGAKDIQLIMKLSGLNEEDIAEAERTFQRQKERRANRPARPKPKRKG